MSQGKKDMISSQPYAAPVDTEDVQRVINDMIGHCSASVFKNYLPYISDAYKVKPIEDTIPPEETVAFFDITKLVTEEKDRTVEKLKNVYHLLAYSNNSLALIIHRKHDSCQIGLAVGKCQDSEAATKLAESVQDAIVGNFPGTSCGDINSYSDTEDCIFQALNEDSYFSENNVLNYNSVAVVSNIASQFSEDFINQGIEKVIDGIIPPQDKEYTMVILGEALNNEILERKKRELYAIYTGLSPYSKRTENWNLSTSKSWGKNWNAGLAFIVSLGASGSNSESNSQSSGASVEINQYGVTHTLEIIEKQMERIERCEALGIWNIATYVLSPDCQLASEVAHMYMSITQGNESFYEKPSINVWNSQKSNDSRVEVKALTEYVRKLIHPTFIKRQDINHGKEVGYWPEEVTPTSVISGAELALAMNLPKKSVPGFSLIECASFGREILSYDKDYIGDVHIGKIHHMHHDEEKSVDLNKNSFASHVFITGSTGAGKSNAVYTILDSLRTTFMVIEPAKGEYKYAFTDNVKVYGSNPQISELLRINPFAFNRGIHVYEHIDRLLDVFNVCWPMYAAMPAVLKDAIIKAYESCGWDLITSENKKGEIFPTFIDVCDEIDGIINSSDYSDENKGNYRGSLKTRLKSLTNGINGLIFCEVMDDEDNDKNFWVVRTKAQEFLKNMKSKENLCTVNIDSQSYIMHYKINENVVYLVITHKKYPAKYAFCFLADIDEGFTEELKNQFGTQSVSYYSKLETIDRANYFLKFEKFIKKKKNEYQDTKNNNNIERLNREISDVHQIMAENINLIMDRDRTMNSINSLSEAIKDNSGRFEKTARETRLKMLLAKYSIFIGIGAIIFLIILFKIIF